MGIISKRITLLLGKDYINAFSYITPSMLVLGIFMGIPVVTSVLLSLQQKHIGNPPVFVGLKNFISLVNDPVFGKTVLNSFVFTFSSIFLKLVIGMLLALILNGKIIARNFWRGVVLIPWVVPTIVTCISWRWMYNDIMGIINYFLQALKIIDTPIAFLGLPKWGMFAVITTITWRDYPFFAISFLAGLQTIPVELYEAAHIDGAKRWNTFWHVTLPMLIPVISTVLITNIILTLNDFQIVHIMTNGGPFFSTEIFSTLMYSTAFVSGEIGKGVAISVIQFPLLISLIFLVSRFILKREF